MVYTKQLCSYRGRADEFAALDATVVGISSQDLESHEGLAGKYSLVVPLLADVDKRVARAYSAYSSRLGAKRAVLVGPGTAIPSGWRTWSQSRSCTYSRNRSLVVSFRGLRAARYQL